MVTNSKVKPFSADFIKIRMTQSHAVNIDPLVSIIMTNYNYGYFLENAIHSALHQRYTLGFTAMLPTPKPIIYWLASIFSSSNKRDSLNRFPGALHVVKEKKRNSVIRSVLFPSLLSIGLVFFLIFHQTLIPKSIYWGAWISGDTYDVGNPPWNLEAIDIFEEHAGKKVSILHWGQPWWHCDGVCNYQLFDFQREQYEVVRQRGAIPLVDWASWDYDAPELLHQPEFSLSTIIKGQHDEYIRQWATQAKAWGHPFFLRFNWEMNGQWFPWSEGVNGNLPGEYVLAWRHVHDIFEEVGAQNVTWVWCPNVIGPNSSIPLGGLYPGDEYVDWVCMDGYNTGTHPSRSGRSWQTFEEIFTETYSALQVISPDKPIMIGEMASTEMGGSKAEWIRRAYLRDLPQLFPNVKAVVWFNWNIRGIDWVIESSAAAENAFSESIASPYYEKNRFSDLNISPIPPAEWVPDNLLQWWFKLFPLASDAQAFN